MKKVLSAFIFTLVLLFSTICFAGSGDCPHVAVLEFTNKVKANKSVVLDKQSLESIPGFVISALLETGRFTVIDLYFDSLEIYAQLYNVDIKELKKDRNKNRIANLLGVKYLIDGAVTGISSNAENNIKENITNRQGLKPAPLSQPAEYKVMLQVRLTDTKTEKKYLVAEGCGRIIAKSQSEKLSESEIYDVLNAAAKDAINGINGVLAKMKEKTQDKVTGKSGDKTKDNKQTEKDYRKIKEQV